jgi:hypothetical protein
MIRPSRASVCAAPGEFVLLLRFVGFFLMGELCGNAVKAAIVVAPGLGHSAAVLAGNFCGQVR